VHVCDLAFGKRIDAVLGAFARRSNLLDRWRALVRTWLVVVRHGQVEQRFCVVGVELGRLFEVAFSFGEVAALMGHDPEHVEHIGKFHSAARPLL